MTADRANTRPELTKDDRAARLAEQLRANLRRRKQQARAVSAAAREGGSAQVED